MSAKSILMPLQTAMATFERALVRAEMTKAFSPEATIHLSHPFEKRPSHTAFFDDVL